MSLETIRAAIRDATAHVAIPQQVAVTPDASVVVYTLRVDDEEHDRSVRQLWVLERDVPPRRVVADGDCAFPTISPDGGCVAFLKFVDEESQLWVCGSTGKDSRHIATVPSGAAHLAWSPDGTRLAFTALVADSVAGGSGGKSAPFVVDRLGYRDHERTDRAHRHIHVLLLADGTLTRVTEGDLDAGEPAWSPDGESLAFSARAQPDSDVTLHSAVHVISADGSTDPSRVGPRDGLTGRIAWYPDGERLLVVGTRGAPHGPMSLHRISVADGSTVDLIASLERNVLPGAPAYPGASPQFTRRGTVVFCARDRGYSVLYEVDADGGVPRPLPAIADSNVRGAAVATGTDEVLIIADAPTTFAELHRVSFAKQSVTGLTRHNLTAQEQGLTIREPRRFRISDGCIVDAWIMRDPAVQGAGPLVVDIHGGPHNAWNGALDETSFYHHELVRRGWTVLLVNPRGSDGYGPEFFNAVEGAWGVADAIDILEPIDELIAEGIADPRRLAVAGYSYGGYLTCYLTSRDDRFAAAVAGGTVADLTSMVGTSIDGRLLEFELAAEPWSDGERYAKSSPYTRVESVDTPTLLLHGQCDRVCPPGQAEQWFHALRLRDVPTSLVLYPGGDHLFPLEGRPSHRIDYGARFVEWVERYTPAEEA